MLALFSQAEYSPVGVVEWRERRVLTCKRSHFIRCSRIRERRVFTCQRWHHVKCSRVKRRLIVERELDKGLAIVYHAVVTVYVRDECCLYLCKYVRATLLVNEFHCYSMKNYLHLISFHIISFYFILWMISLLLLILIINSVWPFLLICLLKIK